MKLTLIRFHSSPNDTLGLLFINHRFAAFTMEDEHRTEKVMHETRIPAGTYKLSLVHSPRFSEKYGHDMISINDVPGFSGILFHKGNTEKDTSGCILIGNGVNFNPDGDSRIEYSGNAYERIYGVISYWLGKEGGEIEIRDTIGIEAFTAPPSVA